MCSKITVLCVANRANSLCSAGCLAAAMSCFVGLRMADTAFFPMLFCIVLYLIAVINRRAGSEGFFTHCMADGAALVVDSRRSAGRSRLQILLIHSFLIVMRCQFAILCIANRANSLCSAGCRTAAMRFFVGLRMADAAFLPMLFGIVLQFIAVINRRAVSKGFFTCRAADGATLVVDSRRSAGRSGFPVLLICKFLILMTGCFCDDRIFIRNLMLAVLIREALFAGGAFPIRCIAVFRAGRVLCRNSSQRVADCDLRRSNGRCDIFKCRNCRAFLEEFTENRNTLRFCVTFQNLKRQCKQDTFIGGHIKLFRCTCICSVYCAAICFSAVFINNGIHIEGGFYKKVRNC